MQDFILRCQFFLSTATRPLSDVRLQGLWLGGLLQPEACVTAMRQLVAQENGWALDKVRLTLRPPTAEERERCEVLEREKTWFLVHGMILEGAELRDGELVPSEEIRCPLDEVVFEWSCREHGENELAIPMYLNDSRSDLICVVEVQCTKTLPKAMWSERAVALIAWGQA